MPQLSFQQRFVPMVADGTKRQTVRKFRPHPIRAGQHAHLFSGLRTENCKRIITPSPLIVSVQSIIIQTDGRIWLMDTNWIEPHRRDITPNTEPVTGGLWNARQLTEDEKDVFAWADGFRYSEKQYEPVNKGCSELMIRWWKKTHELPFVGQVIYW